ncbi:unnamed protein product [Didymodactylos carnosus]|uniref:Uncharacterized protein n=1 Tax=Didymodactylos carnosus TaxID=1234261 RepID=A0A813SNF4_9BILA|nr:unnamed protein product [Didymodactylos carnosus]CAF0835930.1 unnamed protein product [Didymodactylos carnosus]CAF3582380.1 unnamed protein product [Didymodactylos carnosus]CAF3620679.1 unnamed protein product [Didymodactylos carnosus]
MATASLLMRILDEYLSSGGNLNIPSLLTRSQQQQQQQQHIPSARFTVPFPSPLFSPSVLPPQFSNSYSIIPPKTLSFVYQPGVRLYDKKLALQQQQQPKDEDFRISLLESPSHSIETTTGDVDERINVRNESELSPEFKLNSTDNGVMSTPPDDTFQSDTDHRWKIASASPPSPVCVQKQSTTTTASSHPNYYKSCLRRQSEQQQIPSLLLSHISQNIPRQKTSPHRSSTIDSVSPSSSILTQLSTTSQLFIDDQEFNETPSSPPSVRKSTFTKQTSNEIMHDNSLQSCLVNLDRHIDSSSSEQKHSPPSITFYPTSDTSTNSSTHYHQHHHHHHVQMFNIKNSNIKISTEENNLQSVVNLNTLVSQQQTTTQQSSSNNNYEWNKQEMQTDRNDYRNYPNHSRNSMRKRLSYNFDEKCSQPQQFCYTASKRQKHHPYVSNYSNGKKLQKHLSSPIYNENTRSNDSYYYTPDILLDNRANNTNTKLFIKDDIKIKQSNVQCFFSSSKYNVYKNLTCILAEPKPLLSISLPENNPRQRRLINTESDSVITKTDVVLAQESSPIIESAVEISTVTNSKCGKDLLETELNRQKAKLIFVEEKKKQQQQSQYPFSTSNKKKVLNKKASTNLVIDETIGKRVNMSNERVMRTSTTMPLTKCSDNDNKLHSRLKPKQQKSSATTTALLTAKSLRSSPTLQPLMAIKNLSSVSPSTSSVRKRPLSTTQSPSAERKKLFLRARESGNQSPQQGLLLCPRPQEDANENELPKEKGVVKQKKLSTDVKIKQKRKLKKKIVDKQQSDHVKQSQADDDTLRSSDVLSLESSMISNDGSSLDNIQSCSVTIPPEESWIVDSRIDDSVYDPILYQEMKATQKQWEKYMMLTMEHELHLSDLTAALSSSSMKHRRKINNVTTSNDSAQQQSRTKEFYNEYDQLYSFPGFEHWHPNFQYQ